MLRQSLLATGISASYLNCTLEDFAVFSVKFNWVAGVGDKHFCGVGAGVRLPYVDQAGVF